MHSHHETHHNNKVGLGNASPISSLGLTSSIQILKWNYTIQSCLWHECYLAHGFSDTYSTSPTNFEWTGHELSHRIDGLKKLNETHLMVVGHMYIKKTQKKHHDPIL